MTSEYESEAAKLRGKGMSAGRPIPSDVSSSVYCGGRFILGLSPRTLEAMRLRCGGPPFIAVTSKAVRYLRGDLENWLA